MTRPAVSPVLNDVEELVTDIACGDMSQAQCLAILRGRGLNPDPEALADAVTSLEARDRFAGGLGDPYQFLDAAPAPGLNAWETAVNRAESNLAWALRTLARRRLDVAS